MPLIEYYGVLFEWYDDKAELVFKRRGLTLEEVASVFLDAYAISTEDTGHYDEQRLLTVGMSSYGKLITVVWVERGETVRIITAFESALTHQRRYQYERGS